MFLVATEFGKPTPGSGVVPTTVMVLASTGDAREMLVSWPPGPLAPWPLGVDCAWVCAARPSALCVSAAADAFRLANLAEFLPGDIVVLKPAGFIQESAVRRTGKNSRGSVVPEKSLPSP